MLCCYQGIPADSCQTIERPTAFAGLRGKSAPNNGNNKISGVDNRLGQGNVYKEVSLDE